MCKLILVSNCNYCVVFLYPVAFLRFSTSNNKLVSSRSSKMALFELSHKSFYRRFIVAVALSCIVSEIKRDIGRKSRFFSYLSAKHIVKLFTPSGIFFIQNMTKFRGPPLRGCRMEDAPVRHILGILS